MATLSLCLIFSPFLRPLLYRFPSFLSFPSLKFHLPPPSFLYYSAFLSFYPFLSSFSIYLHLLSYLTRLSFHAILSPFLFPSTLTVFPTLLALLSCYPSPVPFSIYLHLLSYITHFTVSSAFCLLLLLTFTFLLLHILFSFLSFCPFPSFFGSTLMLFLY